MGLLERTMGWGQSMGLKGMEKRIQAIIKKKRLVFLGENHVQYIDKEKQMQNLNFDQAVKVFIDIGGWQNSMEQLGLTEQDIKLILIKEYQKQKREVK